MPGTVSRKVGVNGTHRTRFITLPKPWCEAMRLDPGTLVQLIYEDVAVIVPPGRRAAAERVLIALREGGP